MRAPSRASQPSPAFAYPWQPDVGDGTYQNPVIYADYSDPDVIRVGDEFFMVASSFNCTPALPILRSSDLVNWTLVGHALENLPDARYERVQHGEGIWAPSVAEHAGVFYIFAPTPDEGIYVLSAPKMTGPWSAPRLLLKGKGLIDPAALWDDDGRAYLVHAYARSRAGIRDRLRVRPMAPDASRVLGEGQIVFHQPERQPTLEGPKFYKRNGYYFILAPAGGVPTGWQVALRSKHVYGPYEDRVVLERGATAINGPHQGGLVDARDGSSWFLHFQDAGLYGRVVHLNPVVWHDAWPLMGESEPGTSRRVPVTRHSKPARGAPLALPQTSDEFDVSELGPQWQWHANHKPSWASLTARPGELRLFAQAVAEQKFLSVPQLLLQKLPARSFSFTTELSLAGLSPGTSAGLIVMGLEHAAILVERTQQEARLKLLINDQQQDSASLALAEPSAPLVLQLSMRDGGLCRFGYRTLAGPEHWFAPTFQAVPGRWIGAKVGLFAQATAGRRGHADFAYARFEAPMP